MRARFLLGVSLVLVLLVGGGLVAAYVSASETDGLIADGVRAGDVDLSGLSAAEATAVLTRKLEAPRRRNLTVNGPDGASWTLSGRQVKARANVRAIVAEAMDRSQEGSFLTRASRNVTGGELDLELRPRLRFSHQAVGEVVEKAEKAVDRPAQDASVKPGGETLERIPGRDGRGMKSKELRKALVRAIRNPRASSEIEVKTYKIEPKVTTADLPARYPSFVAVDRESFKLRLYKNLRLAETYTIAVGKAGYETGSGMYAVQSKQVDPVWNVPDSEWAGDLAGKTIPPGPKNPLKARFIGFNGAEGFHGTGELDSLGTAASHGCIRMDIPDVKRLFGQVEVGTPVYVD
ncbi:MAG: L,D-transpeptidase/peptidoglycan binding protein [Thermoleophilaceae bacterium]|nr:L,D-transpeptidase/peptidoglycan binding protein [Thermoleophilaceae bacterium]